MITGFSEFDEIIYSQLLEEPMAGFSLKCCGNQLHFHLNQECTP